MRLAPARRPRRLRRVVMGGLLAVALLVVAPALLAVSLWPRLGLQSPFAGPRDHIPASAQRWVNATTTTPLDPADSAFGAQTYPVDTQFAAYYAAHGGQATLGPALTPAFSSNLGLTQFFASGALLRANSADTQDGATTDTGQQNLDADLVPDGALDTAAGVEWLPLSHDLLTLGSLAPIGGAGSAITYATLRAATQPAALAPAPAVPKSAGAAPNGQTTGARGGSASGVQVIPQGQGAFVVEGERGGAAVGHAIPAPIWAYINQVDVAPSGWLTDIGAPLTGALPVTATVNGQPHHLLIQAFWETIVVADLTASDATSASTPSSSAPSTPSTPSTTTAPSVWLQPVGLDYLQTIGAPDARPTSGAQAWLTLDNALRTTPGGATGAASLGSASPVSLNGSAQWIGSVLWYGVAWSTPARSGAAWAPVTALSATRPSGPGSAGFDTLSPSLLSYLSGQGDNVGVVAYDVTRGMVYSYNGDQKFIMASSAKVPLLVSYLQSIEAQGRGPNGDEVATMTTMIENSDNDAAQLIYDTIGYDSGQTSYMRSWGIHDYSSDPNGWGWGQWTPADMAHLLTLLQSGAVLNRADRALAINLMENVESDQRFGAGDLAPNGATVAMKNGWVQGPDGEWAVNSSGIITVGHETYIVTVYSDEQNTFGDGLDIVNHVCGAIGQALK